MDDREYSPQRATRVAAAASMGTLLTLVGFFAGGGDASGAASVDTASTTSNLSTTTTNPGTTSTSTSSTAATTTTVAPCTNTYTVQSGDYWLLLAQEADVAVADLYSLNGAGPDTALFAGANICLPDGATVVTVAPATTAVTRSTTLATNAAASAPAPVVTAAQTTRTSG